jgi:hypothetical protein
MSFQAMAWAIRQPVDKSCLKFLLVMLANYADNDGFCYPSVERLCNDLSQDRKTVVKNLKSLCAMGLLEDSGRRVGFTKSVVVYRVLGLPESGKFYYTYKVTRPETGEYYIGARSSQVDPEFDSYFGSGKWPKQMVEQGVFLEKEILGLFESWEEALADENWRFRAVHPSDTLCQNLELPHRKREEHFRREAARATESNPKNGIAHNTSHPVLGEVSSSVFPDKQSQKRIPDPISKPTSINSISPTPPEKADNGFEQFWEAYPRRIGKAAAEKAYARAVKIKDRETLLKAAAIFARQRKGKDVQFTPHPATWLNQGRWDDEEIKKVQLTVDNLAKKGMMPSRNFV